MTVPLFVVAVAQTGFGAWQFTHSDSSQMFPWFADKLKMWYGGRYEARAHGTYLNPNHLAWVLNTAGIFALSLTCWGRWGIKRKVLVFYVALACFAGVVLTLSRGAFLGLGLGIGGFFLLGGVIITAGATGRRLIATGLMIFGIVAVAATILFLYSGSYMMQQRFGVILDDYYRSAVFWAALREFQLEPLTGAGPGMFLYYSRQYRGTMTAFDDVYAHNDWVQILADFGFPALLLVVVVLVTHFRSGLVNLLVILRERMAISSRPQSHSAAVMVGATCCMVVYCAHSFFDFNMHVPVNALLAAACLGMMANPGKMGSRRGGWRCRMPQILACVICAACAVWLLREVSGIAKPEWLALKAENELLRSHVGEAEALAREGVAAEPTSPFLHRLLGQVLLEKASKSADLDEQLDAYFAAAKEFAKVGKISPRDQNSRYLFGVALYQAGRYKAAQPALIDAVSLSPIDARSYEAYGQTLEAVGELQQAEAVYLMSHTLPFADVARRRLEIVRHVLHLRSRQ